MTHENMTYENKNMEKVERRAKEFSVKKNLRVKGSKRELDVIFKPRRVCVSATCVSDEMSRTHVAAVYIFLLQLMSAD